MDSWQPHYRYSLDIESNAYPLGYTFNGDKDHIFAHHDGILRMIQIRGGIDTLLRGLANQICRFVQSVKLPLSLAKYWT
jgi:hypothetical protein